MGGSSDRSAEEADEGKYFCALSHELELGDFACCPSELTSPISGGSPTSLGIGDKLHMNRVENTED